MSGCMWWISATLLGRIYAEEVAEILDSEKYKDCKVYKIHRAYPDGRMELKGVRSGQFQLEAGMLFYEDSELEARMILSGL